eukprot:SAG11_NODE_136_length_15118_cov_14.188495_22_plen_83_part_00
MDVAPPLVCTSSYAVVWLARSCRRLLTAGLKDRDIGVRYGAWRAAVLTHGLLQLGLSTFLPADGPSVGACGALASDSRGQVA